MTGDPLDDIDDILTDVLSEDSPPVEDPEDSPGFTVAQTVGESEQTRITNDEIEWLAAELEIPAETVELAKSLRDQYRTQRGDLQGTALEMVAASCLYCAAKVTEFPLSPTDFSEVSDTIITKGLLRRSKDIASTVGLDPSAFFGSKQYVDRYAEELDLSSEAKSRAHEIVRITENMGLSSGKSPSGWAAAVIYNACLDVGEKRTQGEIAEVANVTEVTIRNRYQEQREALRNIETLPSDPLDVIAYIDLSTGVESATRAAAEELIQLARSEGYPVDEAPDLWALAALRRGGQLADETVSLKMLSQFTDESSAEIKSRVRQLRQLGTRIQFEGAESGSEAVDHASERDGPDSPHPDTAGLGIEERVARRYDEECESLESRIDSAIEQCSVDRIPEIVNSTLTLIAADLEPELEAQPLDIIQEAHANAEMRVGELIATYQEGQLRALEGTTVEETLQQKVLETFQRSRESAVDIVETHTDQ